jgi:very-short-patch-repair endonuclease
MHNGGLREVCSLSPLGERVGVRGLPSVKGSVGRARRLRRGQTDAERVLWFRLRDRRLDGWKFKRQVPIDRFVVDFCCADAKLILEIDGGQHDQDRERDADRTRVLEAMGYLVLRFWNNDVIRNTDGVLEELLSVLNHQQL